MPVFLPVPYAADPITLLPIAGLVSQAPVGSPVWWRDRLGAKLFAPARVRALRRYQRYYDGDHDLPVLPDQDHTEEEFRRVLQLARSNVMDLVVDVTAERYGVEGFRFGDPDADDAAAGDDGQGSEDLSAFVGDEDAWAIWQANGMDAVFPQVIHEAVKLGTAFLMVEPNPDDALFPRITGEHPLQCLVEYEPGSRRRRAAGIKAWRDDWTGEAMVTLFLPDLVYKWRTELGQWVKRTVDGEEWPAPNPLGEVPLYEVQNRPSMLGGGVSEIADVIKDQDRINKTVLDRVMTQDYGAYPQRWGIGFPKEDKDGKPIVIPWGRTRMVLNDVPKDQAAFGQWDSAPLNPYIEAKREDQRDILARKRIPAHYLVGEMSNVNGETLVATEVGLVAKTRQGQPSIGTPAVDSMRGCFRLRGDERRGRDRSAETIFRDPQYRTQGELVDGLVKMSSLHVPDEALWERWGASPKEIRRWKAMRDEAGQRAGVGDLAAIVAGTDPGSRLPLNGEPADDGTGTTG
jgi:SPP1 Gp6-like portal protein